MLNLSVVCVGTLKESYLQEAVREYEKRLTAYARISIAECREERLPESPSQAEIDRGIQREGERILEKIPSRAYVIALCVEGGQMDSPAFSEKLASAAAMGKSDIVFCIGGSYGLSDAVKQKADLRLSFSKMTFPHQLMRVILLEQLYRAMNLQAGGKYHK